LKSLLKASRKRKVVNFFKENVKESKKICLKMEERFKQNIRKKCFQAIKDYFVHFKESRLQTSVKFLEKTKNNLMGNIFESLKANRIKVK
jgi:hypothetical protein